jgi:hypothetical protein
VRQYNGASFCDFFHRYVKHGLTCIWGSNFTPHSPQMNMGVRVEGGPDSPAYEYVANTVRTLLPVMDKLGGAKAEEVQIETLAQRQ